MSVPLGMILAFATANPIAVAIGATGLVVAAVPAIVASPALAAGGFAADGIVKGSVAAGAQAGIGNVVAPGLFATLQSAGAGGYGLSAVLGGCRPLVGQPLLLRPVLLCCWAAGDPTR